MLYTLQSNGPYGIVCWKHRVKCSTNINKKHDPQLYKHYRLTTCNRSRSTHFCFSKMALSQTVTVNHVYNFSGINEIIITRKQYIISIVQTVSALSSYKYYMMVKRLQVGSIIILILFYLPHSISKISTKTKKKKN